MCGLVGLYSPGQRPDVARLQAMNKLLAHRGPDDAHHYLANDIGLAARRLSIIDLRGGRQPLSNEDGTIWTAYNGEIFNAPALRHRLEKLGHRFATHSDTEIIVHAYESWGLDFLPKLRGMFAFALWDGREKRLILARDRFGIKPLYYAQNKTQDGPSLAFASEIRPILQALPRLQASLNPTALWRLFQIGFIPGPLTAYNQIFSLPPAHYLIAKADKISLHPYWQAEYPPAWPEQALDPKQAEATLRQHIQASVSAWRMSDVPVGALLSGGLDSSTLSALLSDLGGPIHTFNIGFGPASHNESAQAEQVAQSLGSVHHQLQFTEADFDHFPTIIRHLENPQTAMTSIPIYRLYRACREAGFKVVLTGEGADELFAGYHWFDGDRRVRPLLALPQALRHRLAHLPLPVSAAGRRVLAQGTRDVLSRYLLWLQVADGAQLCALLRLPPPDQSLAETWVERLPPRFAGYHPLNQFLWLETQGRMVDFINFEVDRLSMAASVEARPPFLDSNLWDFGRALPPRYKLNRHSDKWLLRQSMRQRLPANIAQRPKQGLAAPHALWWRKNRLPAWAEDLLTPSALQQNGIFHSAEVQRLRQAHQQGQADYSRLLTGVLSTQIWISFLE